MATKIGLDLGYANITVSDASLEVYREPSVALVDQKTRRILSVGRAAETAGVDNALLVRPFKNGLLYSVEYTKEIIKDALRSLNLKDKVICVVGSCSAYNQKQEKEICKMILEEGAESCYFVNRAVAALMGAGYAPSMSVISVNIGASATEIAILHNGDVIYSDTHDIGGEQFDEAVREYILEQGDLSISLLDARAIKEDIGSVWDDGQRSNTVTISGTMALTGNKIVLPVSSEDILGVFEKPLYNLLNAIAQGIKKIPTDYVESIFANGIVLSGGGAMLHGLDKMIEKVFSIGTVLARNPQDCVSSGLSVANSIIPTGLKPNGKNVTSQLAKFYKDKKQK